MREILSLKKFIDNVYFPSQKMVKSDFEKLIKISPVGSPASCSSCSSSPRPVRDSTKA